MSGVVIPLFQKKKDHLAFRVGTVLLVVFSVVVFFGYCALGCLPAKSIERITNCSRQYAECAMVSNTMDEYRACRRKVDDICLDEVKAAGESEGGGGAGGSHH